MKISNIIFIVSLLFASYCAFDFYKKKSGKKSIYQTYKKNIKNNNIIDKTNPTVVNINSIQNGDIEPEFSKQIRAKLPILDNFFNEQNTNQWMTYLTEEDFRMLRDLRSVLESRTFFSQQDEIKVQALEKKNVLNAIRNNDPSMIVVEPTNNSFNPEPAPEANQEQMEPEPEQQPVPEEAPPMDEVPQPEENPVVDEPINENQEDVQQYENPEPVDNPSVDVNQVDSYNQENF